MVLFWSLKTSFDFVGYGFRRLMGDTPATIGCVCGTGVFKSFSVGPCEETQNDTNETSVTSDGAWHDDKSKTTQTSILPPK